MTKEEYATIKLWIIGAYNNFQISDVVWYDLLKELDFPMALESVKNVIKVAKYPMTIAAIFEEYKKLNRAKEIQEYNYLYQIAEEMYNSGVINYDEHGEIEFQINYNKLTKETKNKLYAYKKDKRLLEILKGRNDNEIKQLN